MATARSLTYVVPERDRRLGVTGASDDQLATYMKNFAKIIPSEVIAAYAFLLPAAEGFRHDRETAISVAGAICLVATILIRLFTGNDPRTANWKPQLLPGLGAGLAFALYVYSQGQKIFISFGITDMAELKFYAGLLVAIWVGLAPAILPRLTSSSTQPAAPAPAQNT